MNASRPRPPPVPQPRPVPQPVPDLPARVAVAPPALPRRPREQLPILLPENQSRQSNGWWNYFSRNRRRSDNEQRPYIAPLTPPPVPNRNPAPPPSCTCATTASSP